MNYHELDVEIKKMIMAKVDDVTNNIDIDDEMDLMKDVHLDSIQLIQLLALIEDTYSVYIDVMLMSSDKINSVGKLIKYVYNLIQNKL